MILMHGGTYLTRNNAPALAEASKQHVDLKIEMDYASSLIIASVGLILGSVILTLLCIKRNNTSSQQDLNSQDSSIERDRRDNLAFEATLQRPEHAEIEQKLSTVDIASAPRVNLDSRSHKIRPIGMATRIPHTEDSKSKQQFYNSTNEKYCQRPGIMSVDQIKADLINDIKEFQAHQAVVSENEFSVDDAVTYENKRVATDNPADATFNQRLMNGYSSSIFGRKNRSLKLRDTSVDGDVEEVNSTNCSTKTPIMPNLDRYRTLDSTYSIDSPDSTTHRQRGSVKETMDAISRSRKRTPRMSDAGTQWAIENHLTRRKSSLKSRLSSFRHPTVSKKHIDCVSLGDLSTELRQSATSLESTATQPCSTNPHGSPYKLQFRNSLRPGRKILYRNGARKNDRSVLRKSKKRAKHFEMSIVEESPSFYMSFDSPLPPSTNGKITMICMRKALSN